MRKTIVLIFLICIAFGEWQQSDEIALPKGIQVVDLSVSSAGELYILSTSSILKYEAESPNPLFVQGIGDGRLLTVTEGTAYVLDTSNRLHALNLNTQGFAPASDLVFNAPTKIHAVNIDNKLFVIVNEQGSLTFVFEGQHTGAINTRAERFDMIPTGDYSERQTPLYTLENNRIFAWTGGTVDNLQAYAKKLIYSASHDIFDFAVNRNGNVCVLFSDSIVVLESDGRYTGRISIDNVSPGSQIKSSPTSPEFYVFDWVKSSIRTFSGSGKSSASTITLHANQPNPVDNYTEISFTIDQDLDITITVYNLIGEPVKVIARDYYLKGIHRVTWNADDEQGNLVPNGIYFYRLESSEGVAIKQLIVLR